MATGVFDNLRGLNESFDLEKFRNVFDFVVEKYRDTDGSVDYPVQILEFILPLKPDEDTIKAVMLHDLFLMNFLSEQTVRDKFGQRVLNLLLSLRNLNNLNYAENDKSSQVEILRKMFLTMAKDLRVVIIWLSCRLCQLKDIENSRQSSNAFRLARETMDVYVPIASRLGIYRLKTLLEDLSFKYLDPIEYDRINKEMEQFGMERKVAMEEIRDKLEDFLRTKGVDVYVSGRMKSVYSTYNKLKRKGLVKVDQLYDLFAMRVIVPSSSTREESIIDNLYAVLGLIHSEWKPISSRFKDYVAVPKPNGYKSLHTVVLGLSPESMTQPVEIQIRDTQMHSEAEYGVASHWLYKDTKNGKKNLHNRVQWIKGLHNVHEFFGSDSESMKEVELDIFRDRIFILTPRGEVKDLPLGSIPIDFAYSIHTDVGHRCVMAKVNGVIVPLDCELRNGDVVEIITKNDAMPKLRWLSLVKTNFARHKIKAWFSSLNRENNIKEGRILLNKQLERLQKPLLDQNYSILKDYLGQNLSLMQRETLVEEVGKGSKVASDVIRKIYPYEKDLASRDNFPAAQFNFSNEKESETFVLEKQILVGGEEGLPINFSACCSPGLRDKVTGYVTRGKTISVHKSDCKLLHGLNPERIIFAEWKGQEADDGKYRVGIKLTVVSRVGLMQDITSIIAGFGINIVDVTIKKIGANIYCDCFLLGLDDFDKFDLLLDKLEEIDGVIKVVKDDRSIQ